VNELALIPAELRERPQWVVWRYEERDGKRTKVPYRPQEPTRRAAADDPATWASFEQAIRVLDRERAEGVGFVFGDDPFAGIDLDGCRDPASGVLEAEAVAIVQELDSYTEASPSGTGVHVLLVARLPGERRRKGRIEMYDRARFFCMTGEHVRGMPVTIEQRQAELDALYERTFGRPEPDAVRPHRVPLVLADEELLERALAARNGDAFARLWHGDVNGYESHSEADLALAGMLAFWTGGDPGAIDRLFRSSGLMRPKWERTDYREQTISTAIAGRSDFYEGGSASVTPRYDRPEVRNGTRARDERRGSGAARRRVYEVVGECFPEILPETIVSLSIAATLTLQDQQNPVAGNFEGPPSSHKTTLVDFFGEAGDKVYRSDKFTAKGFVSHAASVSRTRLNEIDMLPRIRHKLMLIPELAPLFGLRNEDLLENFSILTRVFDGHGLSTDSGVHGRRGHTGDFLFAWIGCTTPIEHRVWKTMGKLGSRLLFFEMPNGEESAEQLVSDVAGGESYKDRVARCAEAVADFLDALWQETGGVRGVTWNRAGDPQDVMLRIADYAKVLAQLRGTISVWREGSGDEETYNFSTPVIEKPHRAMSLLYALARGHALVHGRRELGHEDLPIVARAALESTPNDRRAVIRILIGNDGTATTGQVETALRCSAPTARAILETLDKLGVGEFSNPGPPVPATLNLDERLRWLLDCPAARYNDEGRRST
jgi:putative DNA primase/helicase